MLAAMAEIVFQVIPFGLENIVVLILHLPTGATIADNGFDGGFQNDKIGAKSVFVELFAGVFAGNGQFTPIDFERFLIAAEREIVGIAIGIDFAKCGRSSAASDGCLWPRCSPGKSPFRTRPDANRAYTPG